MISCFSGGLLGAGVKNKKKRYQLYVLGRLHAESHDVREDCIMFYLPSKRGSFSALFPTWAHRRPFSSWASDHMTRSSSADGFSQFPPFFWAPPRRTTWRMYQVIRTKELTIWLILFFGHRWCQVIAGGGQSWYIQVSVSSVQSLLFRFSCV